MRSIMPCIYVIPYATRARPLVCEGGIHHLANALEKLAREEGVTIHTGTCGQY